MDPELVGVFGKCEAEGPFPVYFLCVLCLRILGERSATPPAPRLPDCCCAGRLSGHWTLILWNRRPEIKGFLS